MLGGATTTTASTRCPQCPHTRRCRPSSRRRLPTRLAHLCARSSSDAARRQFVAHSGVHNRLACSVLNASVTHTVTQAEDGAKLVVVVVGALRCWTWGFGTPNANTI
jgi:hypothetical protein